MRKSRLKLSEELHWDRDVSNIGSSQYIRYLRMKGCVSTGQSITIILLNDDKLRIEFKDTDYSYLNLILNKYGQEDLKISHSFDGTISLNVAKNDKGSQLEFIETIASVISIDKIKKPLFIDLKIPRIQHKKIFIEDLTRLIKENDFNEALQKVLSLGQNVLEVDDILWVLGQYCEETGKLEWATKLYGHIPEANPRYKDASRQLRHLIAKSENVDPIESLKLQFKLMLKANNHSDADQNDIDSLFHQLAGETNSKPDVHKVGCDPETLIKLAEQLRRERMENQELRARLSELTPRSVFSGWSSLFPLNLARWSGQAPLIDNTSSEHHGYSTKI